MNAVARRRAARLVLRPLLFVLPAAAVAQPSSTTARGVVRGVVHDSLLGQPLAGASVWVDGATEGATTDSAGRFVVRGVPAGRRAVGATHAELEAVGVPTLGASVEVPASGEALVTLATPSPATLRARLCTGEVARGDAVEAPGIVFGEVRDARTDARLVGATATVQWMVIDTVRGKLVVRTPARVVRTDSLGGWYACGVPLEEEVEAWASAPPFESGRASVAVGRRAVMRFDLLVSREPADTARGGSAIVAGVVRDAEGDPYQGARITVEGAPGEARTDAEGRYSLGGLPAGTHTLVVRAIGYAPQLAPVGLRGATTTSADVTLRKVVTIAGVYISVRRAERARLEREIAVRTRVGGWVMDSATLHRSPHLRAAMYGAPFARTVTDRVGDWRVFFTRRGAACLAEVWVDGVPSSWEAVNTLPMESLYAVEVHRDPVPVQFGGARNQCGAVLLWTRWGR